MSRKLYALCLREYVSWNATALDFNLSYMVIEFFMLRIFWDVNMLCLWKSGAECIWGWTPSIIRTILFCGLWMHYLFVLVVLPHIINNNGYVNILKKQYCCFVTQIGKKDLIFPITPIERERLVRILFMWYAQSSVSWKILPRNFWHVTRSIKSSRNFTSMPWGINLFFLV